MVRRGCLQFENYVSKHLKGKLKAACPSVRKSFTFWTPHPICTDSRPQGANHNVYTRGRPLSVAGTTCTGSPSDTKYVVTGLAPIWG